MSNRILVVGLGRFGTALALGLADRGAEVLAVDRLMAPVEAIKDAVTHAVELDSTEPAALNSVEAGKCRVAVVAIGEEFEMAVLSVAALKEIGVRRILARARNPLQARILRAVGADETIEVETEIGRRIAESLTSGK